MVTKSRWEVKAKKTSEAELRRRIETRTTIATRWLLQSSILFFFPSMPFFSYSILFFFPTNYREVRERVESMKWEWWTLDFERKLQGSVMDDEFRVCAETVIFRAKLRSVNEEFLIMIGSAKWDSERELNWEGEECDLRKRRINGELNDAVMLLYTIPILNSVTFEIP